MKNKIWLIFLLLCQFSISQQISINGIIQDKEYKEPIYGAAILMGENYLGFSDVEGVFSFKVNDKYSKEMLTIRHLSYEDLTISVSQLKQNSKILLTAKISSLDEVVIKANLKNSKLEDILKKGGKLFDKMYIDYPYWSTLEYKHILYLDGKPHAFLELDGNILMVGSKVNNPFIDASIVPNQIRRTKESDKPVKSWFRNANSKSFSKTQLGSNEAKNSWVDFRFFELAHPLSKSGQRYFDLSFNNTSEDNEDYIIIDFMQKKDINIATRWLDYVTGQLWINKNDMTLHRVITTYRFEKIFLISYDITYQQISEKLFPKIVKKTKHNFNSYNEEKSKVTISSISYFKDISTIKRENYRKKHLAPWHTFSEVYEKSYWSEKKIIEPKYINGLVEILGDKPIDVVFEKGAQSKEYNENLANKLVLEWEAKGLELKKIMQKDLGQ